MLKRPTLQLLSGLSLLTVFLMACSPAIPKSATKTEDGFYRVAFGEWSLNYYADYIFPPKPDELYPPREIGPWENLGILEADWMMCTKMEPYMASTIHQTSIRDQEELKAVLTNAGVRNLYTELPEQAHVQSYARYQIISHQYPIRTQVVEFLVGEADGAWYRVVFFSNEAGDNMKSEAWKIIATLEQTTPAVD